MVQLFLSLKILFQLSTEDIDHVKHNFKSRDFLVIKELTNNPDCAIYYVMKICKKGIKNSEYL